MQHMTIRRAIDKGEIVLHELSADWSPWKFQVNRFVNDGKDYQRTGLSTLTSSANFETSDEAVIAYVRAQ